MVAVVALLLVPAAAVAGARFTDVQAGQTHEEAIGWVADAGVTQGCDPAGTEYCPTDAVTREQMASFMRRLAGHDPAVAPSVNASTLDGVTAEELVARATPAERFVTRGTVNTGDNTAITEATTFKKVRDITEFTKERSDSELEITMTDHAKVSGTGFQHCIWQLRVDGRNARWQTATTGGLRMDGHEQHVEKIGGRVPLNFHTTFSSVPAGSHTLEMWVTGSVGDACFRNPGNYSSAWKIVEQ